jgi:hypothetical protein
VAPVTARAREQALVAARRHRPAIAELRGEALELERRTRVLLDQVRGDLDPANDYLTGVRLPLGLAGDGLAEAGAELARALHVADRVAAVLGDPTRCGLPWSACPTCLGQGLASSAHWSHCPRCRRRWSDEEVEPCPWPAAATATDHDGARLRLCASHATDARRRLVGARVAWDRPAGRADR